MNQIQDDLHLRLLSIFHYVVGAIAGLFACFPLIHLIVGLGLVVSSLTDRSEAGPPGLIFGLIFVFFAASFIVFGWAFAICIILAGRFMAKRDRYIFCLVMAGVECMLAPFGTVLGVFTILTLVRPSVKELFDAKVASPTLKAA
jgi:hypothetical protein